MENTTKILRELLTKCSITVEGDTSGTEVEDTKYYLYAYLQLKESGYETNYTFAKKTSQDVSAETIELIELTPFQEQYISERLLLEFDEEELPEENDYAFETFCGEKEYGISNEQFFNPNF